MKQVYLFNTGGTNISFSINDSPFLKINSTSISIDWEPLPCSEDIIFTNQSSHSPGQLGRGKNTLTFYPEGFAHKPVTFQPEIPQNISINSLQLYLFCGKDAISYAIAVCINGQIYRLFYPEIK
ncbi:TPA: hypothetical protein PNO53_002965 [Salmonella enterica]|nr:hypothetical protein [Salmonella enterica]